MLSSPFEYEPRHRSLLGPWIERAQGRPDSRGVVLVREDGSEDTFTAGELLTETIRYRRGLERLGLAPGDIVLLALGHSVELIASFLGCVHAGVVPSVSSVYVAKEQPIDAHVGSLKAMVDAAAAKAVVTAPAHVAALRDIGCQVVSTGEITAEAVEPNDKPAPVVNEIAFLQYTSGTGGAAKRIAHPHDRLLCYIESKRRVTPIADDEVIVVWLPLYHDLGLLSGLIAPLVIGVESILISPFHWVRAPAILLRKIHEHRGTATFVPNFALNHCARATRDRDLEGIDLSCLRTWVCGGELVRADSIDLFTQRFADYGFRPEAVVAGYGMAELVEGTTVTPRGRPPRVDWIDQNALQGENRADPVAPNTPRSRPVVSCGAPLPGMRIRIVDADGTERPERHVGEVTVSGKFTLSEYYRQAELTADALHNDWFHTGDLGYVADGELFLTGRKKDLIIVGGRNVQPEEIERLADQVSGLRPGRSIAFGVPDKISGSERVVVVSETAGDIDPKQQLAIERELRRRSVQELNVPLGEVRLVGRGWIAKSSSGKHARPASREKYMRQFGPPGSSS